MRQDYISMVAQIIATDNNDNINHTITRNKAYCYYYNCCVIIFL